MAKVCARPGCARPATARFAFDLAERLVVVDGHIGEWGGSGLLCTAHADTLRPMRGWRIDDRRDGDPRLFALDRRRAGDPTRPVDGSAEEPPTGRGARARSVTTPAPHPSTPLPLDEGETDHAAHRHDRDRPHDRDDGHDGRGPAASSDSGPPVAHAVDAAGSQVRPDPTLGNQILRHALG